MKVSVIVPLYGDRNQFHQIDRGLECLEHQTYDDYEVLIIDDGSSFEFIAPSYKFSYTRLRDPDSPPRSPNMAFLEGFNHASGDFIITSHPELLIQKDAIERIAFYCRNNVRNIPIQYHLSLQHLQDPKFLEIYESGKFWEFKSLPDFWITKTPWTYQNSYAPTQHMHFSFCGQSREGWLRYGDFLPRTEDWYREDCWWHEQEKLSGNYPNPLTLEVYHQWHPKCYGEINDDETNASTRIKRIRNLL